MFTPYYSEDVMYDLKKKGAKKDKLKKDDIKELDRENEDGITILFYLRKIYPGNTLFRFFSFIDFNF